MDESQTVIKTGCETTGDGGCETYIADIIPPTNEGYEFIGWNTAKNATTALSKDS